MARVRLKFVDADINHLSIEVHALKNEHQNKVGLFIENSKSTAVSGIYLDLQTAIKLSKALRTEINRAKEVGNE